VALTPEDLLKLLLGLFGRGEGSVLERQQNRNSTDYPEILAIGCLDTQHEDIQYKDNQHNGLNFDSLYCYDEYLALISHQSESVEHYR
jgi:hypothetical protein